MDKGRRAVQQLRTETECEEKNLRLMECDLSSFDSIRKFARLYNTEEDRLDVLICNAGLVYTPDIYSKDGLNYVMQANYLGHFLLTNLLLNKLKQCRPSRIINVSSNAHQCKEEQWKRKLTFQFLFVDPPTTEGLPTLTNFKTDTMWGSYPPSKACQILSSYKLKHDLHGNIFIYSSYLIDLFFFISIDDGVNAFAVHPGWVWTSFQDPLRPAVGLWLFLILYPFLRILKLILAKTPFIGARTTIYCAVEPSLEHSDELYFK
jgi:NAD(P)-dependent dehydrogenase (short-subunit alcohol dehydrogenase family)